MQFPTNINALRLRLAEFARRIQGWLRPPLTVRVSPTEISLEQGDRKWQSAVAIVPGASPGDQMDALVASFREQLFAAAIPPGRVKLVVSDHWLRPMVFPLPATQLSDVEIELLVTHRYRQVYGSQMQGWIWRWVSQLNGPLVGMAWPESLLGGLRETVADWGGTLASALPESLDAVERARTNRSDTWVVVAGPQQATVVRVGAGAWQHWRCQNLAPGLASAAAENICNLMQQTSARIGDGCRDIVIVESGTSGVWAGELDRRLMAADWKTCKAAEGTGAAIRLPRLDFAHSPGRATRIRHALFAVTALLLGLELGMVAWSMQTMETERAQLEDERGRLQKRLRPAAEPPLSKEMAVRVQAAQGMVARLSVPWEALLATLESVRGDKIIVESLRPDLAGRKVEITAQAPGFGEVAGFVERLNASKTLRQAVLVSEATTRDSSIRFVVTATWSETQ
jgi:hypothetical protein